jgi:hypothetical protein
MKRILLIVNKKFEVEGLLAALLDTTLRPPALGDPTIINYPWRLTFTTAQPRAVWMSFPGQQFELWCIQDLMDPTLNASSTYIKWQVMPQIVAYSADQPNLVVALGTAAYGSKTENHNGCVVMGSDVFIHNYHLNEPQTWNDTANCEKLITSTIAPSFFSAITSALKKSIVGNMLKPFLYPAETIDFIYSNDLLALSTVNVTNPADYPLSDPSGMQAVLNANIRLTVGSVESTHGIIRLLTNAPFIFISGITNRFTLMGIDALGTDNQGNVKLNSVNFSGSFNLGVALAWLMPYISGFLTPAVQN